MTQNINAPLTTEILRVGNPLLRRGTSNVPEAVIGTPAFEELVEIMFNVVRTAPGVGLAAPQIGVPWRLFVVEDTTERMSHLTAEERRDRMREPYPADVVINPVLRATSEQTATFPEGCLSVPGLQADVRRFVHVAVDGFDRRGKPKSWNVNGWPARIFQHEMDHLNGQLYIDRMVPQTLAYREDTGAAPKELLERLGLGGEAPENA
jgi:peptide deformylase